MTLGDGKRKVYMLLDEYSSGGQVTTDADIEFKMADFFDIAQKQLANLKRIVRMYDVLLESGVVIYAMPADFNGVCRVWANGAVSRRKWDWQAGKLLVHSEGRPEAMQVEYFAIPATIGKDTPDEYEFEIAEDAAQIMPYWVAAQQLVTDLVVDYGALLQMYQLQLSTLDTRQPGSGGLRQTFWR